MIDTCSLPTCDVWGMTTNRVKVVLLTRTEASMNVLPCKCQCVVYSRCKTANITKDDITRTYAASCTKMSLCCEVISSVIFAVLVL